MEQNSKAPQGMLEGQNVQKNNSTQTSENQAFEPLFVGREEHKSMLEEKPMPNSDEEEKSYWTEKNKKEKQKTQVLKAVSLSELLQMKFPPKEYIMTPIIPVKGLCMLFASRGVGKTQVGLNVAYAVASGGSFLKWRAEKARRVLYLDGEMSSQTIQERMFYIVKSAELEPQEGFFNLINPDLQANYVFMPNIATKEGQAQIEPHLEGIEFVVIDNLATLARNGRSNEEESWIPIQEWVLMLRRRGISVLIVHHTSKNGSQRGTSAKEDVLDTVIELRHPKDYEPEQGARFELHFTKARGLFGEDVEPFEAQLSIVDNVATWNISTLKEVIADKVQALLDEGLKQREIAQELETSLSTINRIIKKNNLVKQE